MMILPVELKERLQVKLESNQKYPHASSTKYLPLYFGQASGNHQLEFETSLMFGEMATILHFREESQRWQKRLMPSVLIFSSCANFLDFHSFFCTIFHAFSNSEESLQQS